jgi:uncharacterized protein (TIGR01777 family)
MRIVIGGSRGLIGSALVPALEQAGHMVQRLVRPGASVSGIAWDPAAGTIAGGLEGVDGVINLAGRGIGERRWDEEERGLIRHSRVEATRSLASALAGLQRPPAVLINASAVGFYGNRPGEHLTEESPPGEGFFPQVCAEWESATRPAAEAGIRTVSLRSGVVLSRTGGALSRILAPLGPAWLSPYRWGLGGWLGDGTQVWSWISLRDEVRAIVHLLGSGLSGAVNLTAPEPVANRRFMKAVGRALGRPVLLPIPRFVPRLMLGRGLADALLFDSAAAFPERLQADGFRFADPQVEAVLEAALGRSGG